MRRDYYYRSQVDDEPYKNFSTLNLFATRLIVAFYDIYAYSGGRDTVDNNNVILLHVTVPR